MKAEGIRRGGAAMAVKHWVIGASGQLGSALLEAAWAAGETAVGSFYRRPPPGGMAPGWEALDLTDVAAVEAALERHQPEVVWVAAALTDVDYCERHPEESAHLNWRAPARLARLSARHGLRLVYFSSDYVFDGRDGPYDEAASPRPLQVYGDHKRRAEEAVLAATPGALVVRTAWLYGQEAKPRNFVYRVWEQARRGEPIKAAWDQVNTPTAVWALVAAVRRWVAEGVRGIRHAAGPWLGSRFDLTCRILEEAGLAGVAVEPVALQSLALAARRPLRTGLVSRYGGPAGDFRGDLARAVAAVRQAAAPAADV
jgi:dTDP-4-dehydrorhamnose reductase